MYADRHGEYDCSYYNDCDHFDPVTVTALTLSGGHGGGHDTFNELSGSVVSRAWTISNELAKQHRTDIVKRWVEGWVYMSSILV